jgi:hypothetical protein
MEKFKRWIREALVLVKLGSPLEATWVSRMFLSHFHKVMSHPLTVSAAKNRRDVETSG